MIRSKEQFLELWNSGQLGNKLRSWKNLDALKSSGYTGPVGIRSRDFGWKTMYYVPQERLEAVLLKESRLRGARIENLYFGESAPDDHLVLQGEYWVGEHYLMYSRAKLAMKDALALPLGKDKCPSHVVATYPDMKWPPYDELIAYRHEAQGVRAELLLRAAMNANSWDDFQILRDQYPGHVIEFGCYDCELGSVPGRNTLIWELRGY
jgi:hypothetical protein